jgi:hypothetical protein
VNSKRDESTTNLWRGKVFTLTPSLDVRTPKGGCPQHLPRGKANRGRGGDDEYANYTCKFKRLSLLAKLTPKYGGKHPKIKYSNMLQLERVNNGYMKIKINTVNIYFCKLTRRGRDIIP